jgi:alpha-tubulin suppressor-like RCC1 family protein
VRFPGISAAVSVQASIRYDCALLAHGTIECWGDDGITNAVQAAASGGHVCAVLATGQVDCWGRNDAGQLGNGTRISSALPVRVKGITNARAVAVAARGYSCAVLRSGRVECWGHNDKGQLGIGRPSNGSLVPVRAIGLTSAVSISTGAGHACSLLSSGAADCWGYDDYDQLGFGGGPPAIRAPTPVLFGATTPRHGSQRPR